MNIEVSNGEIADKLTIIEIKLSRIIDPVKVANLQKEYIIVNEALKLIMKKSHPLYKELYDTNATLWDIEDRIRDLEKIKNFDDDFIQTARAIYFTNDKRSGIKRKINEVTGSSLFEEKSYEDYR